MKSAFHPTLLAMLCMLGTSSAAWQRLPSSDVPINLANQGILGAKIQSSASIGNSAALLNEGTMELAKVPSGESSVVITLGAQEVVEDISFINEGVSGSVTVSCSTDMNQWTSLAQAGFQAGERLIALKFAGAQAKYVKLSFNASNGASIRSLTISGPSKVSDYKAVQVAGKGTEVDLSSGASGAKPIYMYPTPSNAGDTEGARQTFKFPKTTERYRTVVYDLGSTRTIKKFTAAYSRVPTRLDVFAFEQLPEKKDWRGKLTLDPAIFDVTPIVASGEDAVGKGQMQLSPKQAVKARYVALRFEPNYDKRGVAGLAPEWEAMAVAVVVPYAGLLQELGLVDSGTFTQAPPSGTEGFEAIEISCGGNSQMVLISKAAIAQVQSQLGPNATEQDAINAILAAAGLTPAGTPGGENGSNGDTPHDDDENGEGPGYVGDPDAPLNPASLSALGLSAYRGGGTGGSGPFQGDSDDDDDNGGGGGGGGGSSGGGSGPPIIIVPTSP